MNKIAKHLKKSYFHEKDDLLRGITFDELIITVQSNEKTISAETVKKVYKELLQANIRDAEDELKDNMAQILKASK